MTNIRIKIIFSRGDIQVKAIRYYSLRGSHCFVQLLSLNKFYFIQLNNDKKVQIVFCLAENGTFPFCCSEGSLPKTYLLVLIVNRAKHPLFALGYNNNLS